MDDTVETALIIGGTGMLRGATLWLIARSRKTVLVSRRAGQFRANGIVHAIDADWNDPRFSAKVRAAIEDGSEIANALLWIHDPEPVLAWLMPLLSKARVVLVLGSMDGSPELIESAGNVATVRLGGMPTASGRRWLTNAEISAGAIEALQTGKSGIVGELAGIR
ncbi:hypothetical protein J2046_006610 [Rhizobium petrolearium]|uniref:Short-chain dehydrogenase n=2 Tax=Neorhizobium TaxID=1525371 RepID=A0ABV0MD22_9HYPH|nr:hypothetical protein [Neorhizobium petrolearium]MBP1848319.1 hypothetical protein [Neorhizobium petrolearium]MCC2614539.1 hypothetical protein [Neorhizobium petrolearium]WGI72298.1 hypothetical protein QEO92_32700 [Neorhizobium petrolearium]